MRTLLVLLVLALVAPAASAFHSECPATPTNLTVRVFEGGVYVVGAAVYQETNRHSGLQWGDLPEGCVADTRVA